MNAHTSGPWTLLTSSPARVIARGKHDICDMLGSASNEGVMADARLIAAAPELLEALKLIAFKSANEEVIKIARVAIAKGEAA